MKFITKTTKIYGLILTCALVVSGIMMSVNNNPEPVYAQTCNAGDSVGNLFGYATMSNLPSTDSKDRIYMSTESWNDYESVTTSQQFAVNYNRQTGTWGGRGWSPEIGWVDFGENHPLNVTNKTATFEEIRTDTNGDWGNWNPIIELSDVSYNSDPGGFVGQGANADFTGNSNIGHDDYIGAGYIDFSNVQLIESPCNEYVDVTLNNTNILYQSSCDINNPTIRWTTTNIVPGSCQTAGGAWQGNANGASKPDNNTGNSEQAGDITTTNTPQIVRLQCEGAGSGATIYGEAYASCGEIADCPPGETCIIDPTTGVVIPEFKEV